MTVSIRGLFLAIFLASKGISLADFFFALLRGLAKKSIVLSYSTKANLASASAVRIHQIAFVAKYPSGKVFEKVKKGANISI
jgi:hypothetical protein